MPPAGDSPSNRASSPTQGSSNPDALSINAVAIPAAIQDRLIVALDFPSSNAALALVDRLEGACRWFKIGLELYLVAGNAIIAELRRRNLSVFLDLKLHDIPNTVAAAARAATGLGVGMLTIHAAGGSEMLRAAAKAVEGGGAGSPVLLAVTVLTSMDQAQLAATGIVSEPNAQVERLARMAFECGIRGYVSSAVEVAGLRRQLGSQAVLVTPGIRPHAYALASAPGYALGEAPDDQRRVATPGAAIAAGASYLVVGRPITRAADPLAVAIAIQNEMKAASS